MAFTLANLVREQARAHPANEALVCGERRFTYAELDERSSRLANVLAADGVGPGDRVAVLARNTPEFFELAFAASKLGAVTIGLNWRLAAPEIAYILGDAEPVVLLVAPEQEALVPEGRPAIRLGEEYEDRMAAAPAADPAVASTPGSAVLMLYSSGTTGHPKGVTMTNANLALSERMSREGYGIGAGSVNMVVSPLFHVGGAGYGLMAMFHGATTVLMADAAPSLVLETIERERVTHTFVVPAVIQMLIESPDAATRDLSSLELVAYGAAPMSEALLRRAMTTLGCGFAGVYGLTETTGAVTALPFADHVPDGPRSRLLRSIGRPMPWLEVRVADLVTGEEAPAGEVGEIWVRSGQVMPGYFGLPEATAETLRDDGWLRTGDAAYRDEEGYLFLHDRIKDMIISGGENVYPAEVENALADHEAVFEVAVIGVPSERWGETVKAIVVRRSGADPSVEELTEFTRTRLARYKCPTSVDFVDELPRTASGKLMKTALREAYARNMA